MPKPHHILQNFPLTPHHRRCTWLVAASPAPYHCAVLRLASVCFVLNAACLEHEFWYYKRFNSVALGALCLLPYRLHLLIKDRL